MNCTNAPGRPAANVVLVVLRRFQVLAEVDFDGGFSGAEHVPCHASTWSDVLVAVHALGFRERGRCGQEPHRPDRRFGEPAPGMIETYGALEREAARRPHLLPVPCVVPRTILLREGVDVFGELVRDAVLRPVLQERGVGVVLPVVDEIAALIADLQAMGAGDVAGGRAPAVRPLPVRRPI